jgi:hypothetical protein
MKKIDNLVESSQLHQILPNSRWLKEASRVILHNCDTVANLDG